MCDTYDMYVLQPRRRHLLTWWACSITLSGLPRHQSKVCNSSSSNWLGSVDIILFLGKEQTLTLRETQGERELLRGAKGRHYLQLPLPERSVLHGWYLSTAPIVFQLRNCLSPIRRELSNVDSNAMCAVPKAKNKSNNCHMVERTQTSLPLLNIVSGAFYKTWKFWKLIRDISTRR